MDVRAFSRWRAQCQRHAQTHFAFVVEVGTGRAAHGDDVTRREQAIRRFQHMGKRAKGLRRATRAAAVAARGGDKPLGGLRARRQRQTGEQKDRHSKMLSNTLWVRSVAAAFANRACQRCRCRNRNRAQAELTTWRRCRRARSSQSGRGAGFSGWTSRHRLTFVQWTEPTYAV